MIQETVLNNISVKPLVNANAIDEKKIKGSALIPTLHDCVYLCARRRSGKTSVLAEILKKTSDRKTVFWLFVPTSRVDESWKTIIALLESRGNTVNVFDSIMEGKTNLLDEIITDLSVGDEPSKKEEPKQIQGSGVKLMFEPKESEKKKYEYKPKKIAPKHIFVFDDISPELKNVALQRLCKMSRHIFASVYISSQYLVDCAPVILKQLSYFICFRSMTRQQLDHIHKMLDLAIDLPKFYEIYDFATREPFSFMYVDMKNQSFRKNFNKQLKYDE